MNLGSIILGVIGHIFGNSVVGTGNFNEAADGYLESTEDATNLNGALDNLGKKITGSGLTRAEQQANLFSAQQAELAFNREADFQREMFDRQTELANTSYQRQVADMQAAGLNPMLALGAGGAAAPAVSSAHSSAPSSVTPGSSSLGDLLSLFLLPSQLKSMKAERAVAGSAKALNDANTSKSAAEASKISAEAEKIREETRGSKLQNDYFERVQHLREEGERLANDLTHAQWKEVYKRMDVMSTEMTRNIEQAHSEQEKQKLYVKQAILASEEAANIVYMRPFIKESMEAKSELDRKLAAVAVVDEAYRKGLMDNKVIEKSIEATGAKISVDQAVAELNRVRALREKGDKHALTNELGLLDSIDFWAKDVIDQLSDIVDSIPVMIMK